MFSSPYKSKSEIEQWGYLLIWVGKKGCDIHSTWPGFDDAEKLETCYKGFNYSLHGAKIKHCVWLIQVLQQGAR